MKQKNYQNSTKISLGKLPVWNLKDLYGSPKANNLNNDLNRLKLSTKKFEKKYTSKIAKLSPNQLLKAIIELEEIDTRIDKIMSYAHLLVAEDGNNEKNKIFYQQMHEQITNIASSIVFFSLELNEVSEPDGEVALVVLTAALTSVSGKVTVGSNVCSPSIIAFSVATTDVPPWLELEVACVVVATV